MTNEVIGEAIYLARLSSGLTVAVARRPGFKKVFATFATHYGSIDNTFVIPGTEEPVTVPDGIAHFLEHKMFEKEGGGDVFNDFAALGASSNAYTDYTSTTFLFSSTSKVAENLEILLDFVQRPYFTEANVNKEKGIIEQEIRMYLDMPQDRLHSNLMGALYQHHPVRLDIAGSVESIRTITPELLYQCYQTFYHPSNMVVFIVGDVDPEDIWRQVERNQARKKFAMQPPITRPPTVRIPRVEQKMPVSAPLFMMGYKDTQVAGSGDALLRREIAMGLMWQMLLGKGSPLFADLYQAGLINERFHARYSGGTTFGVSALGGETLDPHRLESWLVERLLVEELNRDDLARLKKKEMGEMIGLFQSPEDLAYAFNNMFFRGIDLLSYIDVLSSITLDEIQEVRDSQLQEQSRAVSLILPVANSND
ncbi:MAG: insulinase family protein [Sulfobacillus benefaciens]|uniref:Insulinase family protein n=1 Tax=Sulfobacillus benefaciens TaxID=453960 RepID=A0A2T2XAW1_9FIRM|nr:MAG: insulinase family protein [Sulfobacillus benefaciens]